jgi:plastocyanin
VVQEAYARAFRNAGSFRGSMFIRPFAALAMPAGDTVEWVNRDAFAHTATVEGGREVTIPPRKAAGRVVTAGDTVDYPCRFHPSMKGRIAVAP